MASQKGKMGSAPTFSKPNLDRLRTGSSCRTHVALYTRSRYLPTDRQGVCASPFFSGSRVPSVRFPRL